MAYEFTKLSEVNAIEAMSSQTNVLVEENGEIVKLAANSIVPEGVVTKEEMEEAIAKSYGEISWDNLKNKPFDEYTSRNTLTYAYGLSFTEENSVYSTTGNFMDSGLSENGDYEVAVNNPTNVVARGMPSVNDKGQLYLSGFLTEDNSILAVYTFTDNGDETYTLTVDNEEYATEIDLIVYELSNRISTIDEKFIPDTIARKSDIPETSNISWNDLTDKPFGESTELVVVTEGRMSGGPLLSPDLIHAMPTSAFVVGDTYTITVDGIDYTGVVEWWEDTTSENNNGIKLFDNSYGSTDPVYLTSYSNGVYVNFYVEGTHDVKISHHMPSIKTIDQELLPTTVPVIQSAQVGQAVVVKSTDVNGKPTNWETVDIADVEFAEEYINKKFSDMEAVQSKNLCSIGSFTFVKTSNYTEIGSTLEPGKTYTFSADITTTDTDNDTCCFYICTSDNVMANPKYAIGRGKGVFTTFTCPDDDRIYNKICLYAGGSSANSVDDTATFANIQIEEGSTATAYIPYGVVTIPAANELLETTKAIINKKPLSAGFTVSDFEIGGINESGAPTTKSSRIRNADFVDASGYTSIEYNIPTGYRAYFVLFSEKNVDSKVSSIGWLTNSGSISLPNHVKYYRAQFASADDAINLTVEDYKLFNIGYGYPALNSGISNIVNKTKWLAVGDSITRGVYSYMNGSSSASGVGDGWVRKLAAALGHDITVMASRGMGYTDSVTGQDPIDSSNPRISLDTLLTRIEALTDDFNLITLAFGINDYNTPSSTTKETILAGFDDAVQRLMAKWPMARIVVITPFNSCRVGDDSTNYAYNYTQGDKSLKDVADTIKERCQAYGIECIYATNGFIFNNFNIKTLLPDKVHPSDIGHSLIAKNMAHYLLY